jgi:hypothetical protein
MILPRTPDLKGLNPAFNTQIYKEEMMKIVTKKLLHIHPQLERIGRESITSQNTWIPAFETVPQFVILAKTPRSRARAVVRKENA